MSQFHCNPLIDPNTGQPSVLYSLQLKPACVTQILLCKCPRTVLNGTFHCIRSLTSINQTRTSSPNPHRLHCMFYFIYLFWTYTGGQKFKICKKMFKEVSSVHPACIYFIKAGQPVIMSNINTFYNNFCFVCEYIL